MLSGGLQTAVNEVAPMDMELMFNGGEGGSGGAVGVCACVRVGVGVRVGVKVGVDNT